MLIWYLGKEAEVLWRRILKLLVPGQSVKLGDGNGGGGATFRVKPSPFFGDVATVQGKSPEDRITLQKGGVIPSDGKEHSVGRQGLTIEHEPTGGRREIVHVSYRS
ncbi:MAG: hypothetical protein HYW64_00755 [Candidatus Levybacteria bacterium]|nr:hypothetical protein [Candidatus Levybacteria bacterium]